MAALMALTFTIPGTGFDIPSNVVILGTITGLTYALIAVGITLVYRTSRVLNFAAGEMGALPAVLIPILVINNSWPYWLALSLSLLGALVLSVATEAFVISFVAILMIDFVLAMFANTVYSLLWPPAGAQVA